MITSEVKTVGNTLSSISSVSKRWKRTL